MEKRAKFRVMVTGRLGKVTRDLSEHLENDRGYATVECSPKRSELLKTSLATMPQAIVICLRNENPETIKTFDILAEPVKVGAVTIIVVANEEDTETFTENTALQHAVLLPRPLPLSVLYYKLHELEASWRDTENGIIMSLNEFDRPADRAAFPRRHILVVDDDPEQLVQIREHLQEFYETTLVGSGKSVMKYLDRFQTDLILLDYIMPEMDGPAVLKELRSHDEYKDIPVIFLTGVTEKELVIKTITELKPQGYLVKPAKKSEIVARIIDVLG